MAVYRFWKIGGVGKRISVWTISMCMVIARVCFAGKNMVNVAHCQDKSIQAYKQSFSLKLTSPSLKTLSVEYPSSCQRYGIYARVYRNCL